MVYAMGHGAGFGLGFLNFLGTILFILAIVWTVKFFVRGGRGFGGRGPWSRRPGGGPDDTALHVARERYARGEISEEQYEGLRTGLRGGDGGGTGRGPEWLPWNRDAPTEVARLRFARGEISAEEYQALARTLREA
ncbi:MAG: SHOCT domain-containing protein [Trueperaceae bacterium]|nr:SHOCT domain-containing protein [Trueperaceae bacterium]